MNSVITRAMQEGTLMPDGSLVRIKRMASIQDRIRKEQQWTTTGGYKAERQADGSIKYTRPTGGQRAYTAKQLEPLAKSSKALSDRINKADLFELDSLPTETFDRAMNALKRSEDTLEYVAPPEWFPRAATKDQDEFNEYVLYNASKDVEDAVHDMVNYSSPHTNDKGMLDKIRRNVDDVLTNAAGLKNEGLISDEDFDEIHMLSNWYKDAFIYKLPMDSETGDYVGDTRFSPAQDWESDWDYSAYHEPDDEEFFFRKTKELEQSGMTPTEADHLAKRAVQRHSKSGRSYGKMIHADRWIADKGDALEARGFDPDVATSMAEREYERKFDTKFDKSGFTEEGRRRADAAMQRPDRIRSEGPKRKWYDFFGQQEDDIADAAWPDKLIGLVDRIHQFIGVDKLFNRMAVNPNDKSEVFDDHLRTLLSNKDSPAMATCLRKILSGLKRGELYVGENGRIKKKVSITSDNPIIMQAIAEGTLGVTGIRLSLIKDSETSALADRARREKHGYGKNPASWVKDEGKWNKAKTAASETYDENDKAYWAVVTSIYKKMGGRKNSKKKSLAIRMAKERKHGESHTTKSGWKFWKPTKRFVTDKTFKERTSGKTGSKRKRGGAATGLEAPPDFGDMVAARAKDAPAGEMFKSRQTQDTLQIHRASVQKALDDMEIRKYRAGDHGKKRELLKRRSSLDRKIAKTSPGAKPISILKKTYDEAIKGTVTFDDISRQVDLAVKGMDAAAVKQLAKEFGIYGHVKSKKEYKERMTKKMTSALAETMLYPIESRSVLNRNTKTSPQVSMSQRLGKLTAVYDKALNDRVTFSDIDSAVFGALNGLNESQVKQMAKDFGINRHLRTKKAAADAIRRTISRRKEMRQRLQWGGPDSGGQSGSDDIAAAASTFLLG